jgi:hypothetical protein
MSSHLANDDDNSSEQIFNKLEEYMFTRGNMAKYNKVFSAMIVEKIKEEKRNKMESQPILEKKKETHFIPFQKDKLFWSFYIILNGFEEYELHNSDHFITEKNFKIAAVEKLRSMKDELKEAKLKKNEIEDELVNHSTITLKGLHALCLLHQVSITYIYGRKYCEFLYSSSTSSKSGVIVKTDKNEESVRYDATEDFMTNIRNNFWKIENVQKPLSTSSSYSVKDLQDICKRLEISITLDTGKNKTKQVLYEDILKEVS